MSADDPKPGATGASAVETARNTTAPKTADDGRRTIGDPDAPLTPLSDPTGQLSNRIGGTVQREPTPEQLPPDAKVAPIAEQVAPNQAAQAVGALPTPEEVAGVPTEPEGEKNVVPDTSNPTQFLAPSSEQQPQAERAATTQGVAADDAAVGAVPADNPEGKAAPKPAAKPTSK